MTSLRNISGADDGSDLYLDAARDCLLDLGWRRTTLTEVARRAGVSRMTIYRTWADMPALLGDLMTREWAGVVGAAADHARRCVGESPTVDLFAAGVLAAVRGLRENELFVRIVELDAEVVLPYLFVRRGRSQDRLLARLVPALRDAQARGEVRACDPDALARSLLLAAHGHVLSAHTMVDDDVDAEALDAELCHLVRGMLRPLGTP